ncbi:hypothetical protein IJM16_04770 [Candidatus Saccharibacteria bacterium]|nr:hypothetical protein [Candidatus Saccharibacteria bacterium]
MDDGGNKSEFELEVSEKDMELVSADIESPGDESTDLPTDDTELIEGDLPAPEDDPAEKAEKPKPTEDETTESELDSELEALEEEEKAEEAEETTEETTEEEKAAEAADAAEASEETTLAADIEDVTTEEEPAQDEEFTDGETPAEDEMPVEEEKPVEEEEPTNDELAEEKPVEEETTEDERAEDEPIEDAPVEETPTEDEKPAEDAPIVVEGVNAPVDSTQANSTFPVKPAEEKKKSNKTGLFVAIAIALLLLIGGSIYFALSGALNGGNSGGGGNNNRGDLPPSKVDGLSDFDVKLLKNFKGDKNIVYSPMSIKIAMSILMDATDGSTMQEMVDVIGDYKPKNYTNSEHLSVANAFFVRDDFKDHIKKSYTDAIKDRYNTATIYDPFNNAATINDWVYTNTLNLIPKILSDSDLNGAMFVIGNTVAIDMEWDNMIQCAANKYKDCKDNGNYNGGFIHEKFGAQVGLYDSEWRDSIEFNGKETLAMEFGAAINNYDLIKVIGEEKVRSTVRDAYDKCVAERHYEYECSLAGADDIDEYIDKYVSDINNNFGKSDSSTTFKMYFDDTVKVFAKDFKEYDGTQLQYVGIMPTQESLSEFISDISAKEISELIESLKDIKNENFEEGEVTKVIGSVPEFDFDEDVDLVDEFKKLGVEKVFREDADLSKMLKSADDNVSVGSIKHAAKIQFTNFGVKAAAATTIIGVGSAMDTGFEYSFDVPTVEIDMIFDKPFLYLIRDKETGEVWFMGTVYEGVAATN